MLWPSRARATCRLRSAGPSATNSRVNSLAGEVSAGIIEPFSVYDGLLAPPKPRTSEGKRVWCPKCRASNWSSDSVFFVCAEPDIGAAVSRLASARWPPDTPGCDAPETSVIRSRRSASGSR